VDEMRIGVELQVAVGRAFFKKCFDMMKVGFAKGVERWKGYGSDTAKQIEPKLKDIAKRNKLVYFRKMIYTTD
jgi:hypothetical protein